MVDMLLVCHMKYITDRFECLLLYTTEANMNAAEHRHVRFDAAIWENDNKLTFCSSPLGPRPHICIGDCNQRQNAIFKVIYYKRE